VGVVIAESSTADMFDEDDGHFIQGVANLVGTVLLPWHVFGGIPRLGVSWERWRTRSLV
jgi:hypothetical protein